MLIDTLLYVAQLLALIGLILLLIFAIILCCVTAYKMIRDE